MISFERDFHYNSENRKMFRFKLNMVDYERLRRSYLINESEIIITGDNIHNCSICLESLENVNMPIIKLPKCFHIFHWRYLKFNLTLVA